MLTRDDPDDTTPSDSSQPRLRIAMLCLHTSPLRQPGQGDAGGMNVYVRQLSAELVRLGADFTFLRRSFTADMAGRDPFVEVPRLLAVLTGLATATADEVAERRAAFLAAVTGVPAVQSA